MTTDPLPPPPPPPAQTLRYRELGADELAQFVLVPGEATVGWRPDGWWVWWCVMAGGTPDGATLHACPVTVEGWGSQAIPLLEGVPGRADAWDLRDLGFRIEGVPVRVPWRS